MNDNKIIFTYDSAADSLRLSRESGDTVPVFDPADITDILRTLSKSEQPVSDSVNVTLNNRKAYRMEITSEEPQNLLNISLTEIE